jgi:hypothetical protein
MHESFREYVEALHPSFGRLLNAGPVKIKNLPRDAPSQCIYLFKRGIAASICRANEEFEAASAAALDTCLSA